MAKTSKMQEALVRLEEHRVEIETLILSDMERKLAEIVEPTVPPTVHYGLDPHSGPHAEDDPFTHSGSTFTFTWFGIG